MTKNLCFVFLGEFGYELLDWQAKIRKLSKTNLYQVTAASRSNCEMLYRDSTKLFISLDDCSDYYNSKAHSYFAHEVSYDPASGKFSKFIDSYRAWIRRRRIAKFARTKYFGAEKLRFIFSDQLNVIEGISFGAQRNRFEAFPFERRHPSIYTDYILRDNEYVNLSELLSDSESKRFHYLVENKKLLIVIQRAERKLVIRSDTRLDEDGIIAELSKYGKIVLLEYLPSRALDTSGEFNQAYDYERITFRNLSEQISVLIHADICVSLTHGDFRSHNYIAPAAGKTGYSIAPFEILKNSALELWNDKIFSGRIVPIPSDNLTNRQIAFLLSDHAKF